MVGLRGPEYRQSKQLVGLKRQIVRAALLLLPVLPMI